jgi:beta-glucosidase
MKKILLTLAARTFVLAAFLIILPAPVSHASPLERTPESAVTPSEKSRHTGFMRQIKDGNGDFDFVLIGDSITDYWPGKGNDSYSRFAPWKPLDLGVSAETTDEVLWRLLNGELDGIHPKVVMIMIGTNNLGHYRSEKPEWVAAGIKKIIETVRAKQPQAKILLLAIFPRGATSTDVTRQRIDEVNKLLPVLADDKNVFFMDIGPKFLDPQGNLPREIMPDLLHPNADGYRIWIEAVRPKLEELMGSSLAPAAPTAPLPAPASSASPSPKTLSN